MIKDEYKSLLNTINTNKKELEQLVNDETVKRYLELLKEQKELSKNEKELYKEMKFEEFSKCKHIIVTTSVHKDRLEGRISCSYGCIKCGVNTNGYNSEYLRREDLDFEDQVIYDYVRNYFIHGTTCNVVCTIDLATAIYSRIKNAHPDIDDETAIKYFKNAYVNMIYKYSNLERVENRIKRLSLNNNFRYLCKYSYEKTSPGYSKKINKIRDEMNEK